MRYLGRLLGRVAALKALNSHLKVAVTSSRLEIAQQALDAQADAYVCISEPPEQVVQLIQTISKPQRK